MDKKYTTKSFSETQRLGKKLAMEILNTRPQKSAVVLGLRGDLGAGKTTFLQGFAKGLGIHEKITSPTFVIMKSFQIPTHKLKVPKSIILQNRRPSVLWYKNFYHIDCYRLNRPQEMLDLGFKEIISNPENIVAIEWPEKIAKLLPKKVISIDFDHDTENQRALTIKK